MKLRSLLSLSVILVSLSFFSSCTETEDPGPLQEVEREYNVEDFDRLEIGDALHVDVEQGNYFEISVRGDRRNVDDLDVYKEGSTLIVRFDENRNRQHDTYVTITMPTVEAINFSGASNSRISGFYDLATLDFILSGASTCQLDVEVAYLNVVLSGASVMTVRGSGDTLACQLSGASLFRAFEYPVMSADVRVSGASSGKVAVQDELFATASGASSIIYRGNPIVDAEISDTSTIQQD